MIDEDERDQRSGQRRDLLAPSRRLSEDDRRILPLLCAGLSDKEIAAHLVMSRAGVVARVRRLCRRLRARNRTHAVHIAYVQGILAVPDEPPRSDEQFTPVVRVPHDSPEVIAERRRVLLGIDERRKAP